MSKLKKYLDYGDPLIIAWRDGTTSNPFIDKEDTLVVVKNTVILNEIPDEFTRVSINGYAEVQGIPKGKQFFVNYDNGVLLFDEAENGKTIVAKYKGKGIIMYPASRIYYHNDKTGDMSGTLQSLADDVNNYVESAENLDQLLIKAEALKLTLEDLLKQGATIDVQINESIAEALRTTAQVNAATGEAKLIYKDLSAALVEANSVKIAEIIASLNSLKESIDIAARRKTELDSSINTSVTSKANLDTSISTATSKNTELGKTIATATISNTDLKASIKSGDELKTNLDLSIVSGTSTKKGLDASITTATSTNTTLSRSIESGNALNTKLNQSINTGNSLKTSIDNSIDNAKIIDNKLSGSIVGGQNKIEEMDSKMAESDVQLEKMVTATNNSINTDLNLQIFEEYNPQTSYKALNKVTYQGSSFVCIKDCVGVKPTVTNNWLMIAAKGRDGTGRGTLTEDHFIFSAEEPTTIDQLFWFKEISEDEAPEVMGLLIKNASTDGDTPIHLESVE